MIDYRKVWEKEAREEGLAEGRASGLADGIIQGQKQEKYYIAKSMLSDGVPVEKIVQYSGLSSEEVADMDENK